MFDANTVALIAGAPDIAGQNLTELPQRLTEAYASIVTARIRIRDAGPGSALPPETLALVEKMHRLAFTYEAFVSSLPERADRASAAFVAGAAHHVCLLAEMVGISGPRHSRLGIQGISPEISATLLFLVAEASADAAEMAKIINGQEEGIVESALLTAIRHLANGRLEQLLDEPLPVTIHFLDAEPTVQAVRTLYYLILKGIRALAVSLLGPDEGYSRGIQEVDSLAEFERVKRLCLEVLPEFIGGVEGTTITIFPGPFHLASLLSSVAQDLSLSALVAVPAPPLIDPNDWAEMIRGMARRRPYLWRNHREAISAGYLYPGVSSVISFPTGSGKSTLAELKIATIVLQGLKVVFLAPTLALVDQTAKALAKTFPGAELKRERNEDLLFDFENEALSTISVMTPERCLALLSFDPESFSRVGLLIFDECHLLHPRDLDHNRRSIDAMLCLLNFTNAAPGSDLVLLSAMVKNAPEIADWINNLTGRPCIPLALTWKPTRQVRGCVVYQKAEINRLNNLLAETRKKVKTQGPPAVLKRSLFARPFGFFCLRQTWLSNERQDYSLLPLLVEPVVLATGTTKWKQWYLTPNGNKVAAILAQATASKGMKTLVFTQTIPLATSATSLLTEILDCPQIPLNTAEQSLYALAVEEMGGSDFVYLGVTPEGALKSSSVCHHGLLLPVERQLHESLFKRKDGVNVMVATSTLAQGMNLPSEVVIIAGDSRFNPDADRMERLEAHELLNAAGRAGRAGENSYGFVLVVPSKVVDFDNKTGHIHGHWADLQSIFAQSDQCLEIEDPIAPMLDQIHQSTGGQGEIARYFISRLPVDELEGGEGPGESAQKFLRKSFGVHCAIARGDQAWVDSRIDAVLAARNSNPEANKVITWADRVSAAAGVPVGIVRTLGDALQDVPLEYDASMLDWYKWLIDWLGEQSQIIPMLIRRESLEGLFGKEYIQLLDDESKGRYALPILTRLLDLWMMGASLVEIENAFGTESRLLGKCENAREFVLRLIPELAYLFGLPAQILLASWAEDEDPADLPLHLKTLGSCVREGFDSTEKLLLRQIRKIPNLRIGIHQEFNRIEPFLLMALGPETFSEARARIKAAIDAYESW